MALSNEAMQLKKQMSVAVSLKRALEAMQEEWKALAESEECLGEELVWELLLEKRALQRQFAEITLKNWVRLRQCGLNSRRFRLMKLRYVQGCSWAEIIQNFGCSKQHLMREHNRALEQVVKAA